MKSVFVYIAGLAAFCLLLDGCGQSGDKAAFDSASPEIKACWLQSLADDNANNYVAANTNLVSLLGWDITPAQLSAVQAALNVLNERMNNAAAHGDAAAQKALETLRTMRQSHARPASGTSQ